jgi:large subunit ribosomal protein L25
MLSLLATIRNKKEKTNVLRKQGFLPAVLYGESIAPLLLKVNAKDFQRVFAQSGETSLLRLQISSSAQSHSEKKDNNQPKTEGKEFDVLVHQVHKDPLRGNILHIDFFHPSAKKKIVSEVPLVFEGESAAVNDLGGVLMKELQLLNVRALASNLPHQIEVDISGLKTLEDKILVKDLHLPLGVQVVGHHPEDLVAHIGLPKEEKTIEQPVGETEPEQAKQSPDVSKEE